MNQTLVECIKCGRKQAAPDRVLCPRCTEKEIEEDEGYFNEDSLEDREDLEDE
jgi:hypothetical protein